MHVAPAHFTHRAEPQSGGTPVAPGGAWVITWVRYTRGLPSRGASKPIWFNWRSSRPKGVISC